MFFSINVFYSILFYTLKHWDNLQLQSMQTKRWSTIFSQFNLTFVQIKSHQNPVDAISRMYNDMTQEQRARVTPEKSDELDDFVLSVNDQPIAQTTPELISDEINNTEPVNNVLFLSVDASSAVDIPIPPPRKRRLQNKSVCIESTLSVNVVTTRSMDKKSTASAPVVAPTTSVDNNNSAADTAGNYSTSADAVSSDKTATDNATPQHDVPRTNELTFENANLDTERDDNNNDFEPTDDTKAENNFNEIQL